MNLTGKLKVWYENLSASSVEDINQHYADGVFFKDPFNEMSGLWKIKKLYLHMFEMLESPRFVFIDVIEENSSAFITWDFIFTLKGRELKIHGSSHLKFDDENKIIYHRDYWDVGEEILLKIPGVKHLYGAFQKKMSLPK